MINMQLLPKISVHFSANTLWECSNLLGRICCIDLTSNSHNQFTRKCVAAGGENQQSDLGSQRVKRPDKMPWMEWCSENRFCSLHWGPVIIFTVVCSNSSTKLKKQNCNFFKFCDLLSYIVRSFLFRQLEKCIVSKFEWATFKSTHQD